MPEEKIVLEFDVRAEKRRTIFEFTKRLSHNKKVRRILRRKKDG